MTPLEDTDRTHVYCVVSSVGWGSLSGHMVWWDTHNGTILYSFYNCHTRSKWVTCCKTVEGIIVYVDRPTDRPTGTWILNIFKSNLYVPVMLEGPKFFTRSKWKMTKMEDDPNGRRPK